MGLSHQLFQRLGRTASAWREALPLGGSSRRRTHLYSVGTAKSGTNSIGTVFADRLRSDHEPENERMIDVILRAAAGDLSTAEVRRYLKRRDRRLNLEIDSSQLNYFVLADLVDLFPESIFVLTIRNPYAWLDSFINHQLGRGTPPHWQRLRDFRFRPERFSHPPEESALRDRGLYTLNGYLSYWATHNETVLNTVPRNRLLVVRTNEISQHADKIAAFAGVNASAVSPDRSHANKAKKRFYVLRELDVTYVARRVDEHCRSLMHTYFPHIAEPADGLSYLPSLSAP